MSFKSIKPDELFNLYSINKIIKNDGTIDLTDLELLTSLNSFIKSHSSTPNSSLKLNDEHLLELINVSKNISDTRNFLDKLNSYIESSNCSNNIELIIDSSKNAEEGEEDAEDAEENAEGEEDAEENAEGEEDAEENAEDAEDAEGEENAEENAEGEDAEDAEENAEENAEDAEEENGSPGVVKSLTTTPSTRKTTQQASQSVQKFTRKRKPYKKQ